MQDDHKKVPITKLPSHLQKILEDREYTNSTITAVQMAKEYSAWHIGDPSWADNIIWTYNAVIDIADKE